MSNNLSQQAAKTVRVRKLFVAALVLACAFGTVTNAAAQKIASPTIVPTKKTKVRDEACQSARPIETTGQSAEY